MLRSVASLLSSVYIISQRCRRLPFLSFSSLSSPSYHTNSPLHSRLPFRCLHHPTLIAGLTNSHTHSFSSPLSPNAHHHQPRPSLLKNLQNGFCQDHNLGRARSRRCRHRHLHHRCHQTCTVSIVSSALGASCELFGADLHITFSARRMEIRSVHA